MNRAGEIWVSSVGLVLLFVLAAGVMGDDSKDTQAAKKKEKPASGFHKTPFEKGEDARAADTPDAAKSHMPISTSSTGIDASLLATRSRYPAEEDGEEGAAEKQTTAQQVLREAAAAGEGVISVQVLGEFFHATVTRKKLLDIAKARVAIAALRHLQVVNLDEAMVEQAIDFHERFQLRYWDALIVASAKLSGCVSVLSEDLSEGQNYDGVAVVNPFNVPGA